MFFQLNLCYRQLGTSRESLIVQSQGSLPFTPPSSLLCSRVFFVSPVSCFIVVPFPSLLCLRCVLCPYHCGGYMVSHRSSLLRRSGRTAPGRGAPPAQPASSLPVGASTSTPMAAPFTSARTAGWFRKPPRGTKPA